MSSHVSKICFIGTVFLATCHAASFQKAPPSMFSSSMMGSGWGNPITSTSTGYSGLSANQSGNAGQSLSFQANGTNMGISLLSNAISDGYANLVQAGGNSGGSAADVSTSAGSSGMVPESTLQLEMTNADSVNVELDTQALGFEAVDTVVEQQAQVTGGGSGASGWGSGSGGSDSTGWGSGNGGSDSTGWGSGSGPSSSGATLQTERQPLL